MTAIRLEKFTTVRGVSADARIVSEAEIETIRKEAFENGVRDGAAAATDAFSSEHARCLSRIQEAIGDTFFAREEAHRQALASLRPLIEAVSEAIAPELCRYGLSAEIAKIAQEAAIRAPEAKLTVFVAHDRVEEISSMLNQSNPALLLSEDSDLGPAEARVCWSGGFNQIDLSAAASSASVAINEFFCEIESPENTKVQNAN